jgi:HD superfamily phosphohydrolase
VARDNHASGTIKAGSFDIDRILKNFILVQKTLNDGRSGFQFLPAIQAINDIDRFFLDRYYEYKMMINHHRVKKFDSILQFIIKDFLNQPESKSKLEQEEGNELELKDLGDMLLLVFKLINTDTKISEHEIERLFLEFSQVTDYWLLEMIKRRLLQSEEEEMIAIMRDELFSGSKKIKPLFKTHENFLEIANKADMLFGFDFDYVQDISKRNKDIFVVKGAKPKIPTRLEIANIKTKKEHTTKAYEQNTIIDFEAINKHLLEYFVFFNTESIEKEEVYTTLFPKPTT